MGPLAIDMYLPALPTIAREFGADAAAVQVSLAAYFAGIAIGQAFYGPLSDGCRPQAGALLRPDRVHRLVDRLCVGRERSRAGRVPLSAGPRRLRTDRHPACGRARLFRSARLDPDAVDADAGDGAGADPRAAHRWAIAGQLRLAIGVLVVWPATRSSGSSSSIAFLPESLPIDRRRPQPIGAVIGVYARLLRDRTYIGYVLSGALIFAGLLAYISGSPFVFIELFHVPPERYGIFFGINAHRDHGGVTVESLAVDARRGTTHRRRHADRGAEREPGPACSMRTPDWEDSPASSCRSFSSS